MIYDTQNKRVGIMYNYIVDFVNSKMPSNPDRHIVVGKQIDVVMYQLSLSSAMNRWLTPNDYAKQERRSLRSVRKFMVTPLALYLGVQRIKIDGKLIYRIPSLLSSETWHRCVLGIKNDDERRMQIVSYLKTNGRTMLPVLTYHLSGKVSRSAVLKTIAGMVQDGIVIKEGKARGATVKLAPEQFDRDW